MPHLLLPGRAFRTASLVLFSYFVAAGAARAQKGPDVLRPSGYVNDFANVLSQNARFQLTALCTEVDQKASAQISVVTIKSLDGQPIEQFSVDLATRWGIGPKQSARGVMILLAVEDRRYRFEVGYGLESILPDGKTGGFGREAVPYLREGNYDAAIFLMTQRVADVIAQDRGVVLTVGTLLPPSRSSDARHDRRNAPPLSLVVFLIFLAFSLFGAIKRSILGGPVVRRRGGGGWVGPMMGGGGWGGGFGGGGGGGGGGFGGFGGGSFGGGGSSGSW